MNDNEEWLPSSEIWDRARKLERSKETLTADEICDGLAALDKLRARYVGHPQPAVEPGEKSA